MESRTCLSKIPVYKGHKNERVTTRPASTQITQSINNEETISSKRQITDRLNTQRKPFSPLQCNRQMRIKVETTTDVKSSEKCLLKQPRLHYGSHLQKRITALPQTPMLPSIQKQQKLNFSTPMIPTMRYNRMHFSKSDSRLFSNKNEKPIRDKVPSHGTRATETEQNVKEWFYVDDLGIDHGPFSKEIMTFLFVESRITTSMLVHCGGRGPHETVGSLIKRTGTIPFLTRIIPEQ